MKKYLYLLFVAIFAAISFSVASCSSDDDEPNDNSIIGKWYYVSGLGELGNTANYIIFEEDGTYTEYTDGELDHGTYSIDGNNITVKLSGSPTVTYTFKVKGKTLTINMFGMTATYEKR